MNAVTEPIANRVYLENDPDLPDELRELVVRVLTKHIENSTNPHFMKRLNKHKLKDETQQVTVP